MGVLVTESVSKIFGDNENCIKALASIDLFIGQGFTAITGPSGSGKSTLLHILGGLERPTSGRVLVNNTDLSIFDEEGLAIFRRRNLGFIFREYNLIPILNVYENITFTLNIDGREPDFEYINQLATLLNIEKKMDYFPNNLSVGEKQRVAIARALATKPAVVLADEPTGNLDSNTSLEVVGLLKLTSKEFKQAVVMVTHDKEIASLADKTIFMKDGNVERVTERRRRKNGEEQPSYY